MNFEFQGNLYKVNRFPTNNNNSLLPWNTGDVLALSYLSPLLNKDSKIAIANDDYGFLGVNLNLYRPINILNNKSQEYALEHNWKVNNLNDSSRKINYCLESISYKINFGILRIPKSIDLFELYLKQLHESLEEGGTIICPFMTKYFTPQLIKVAEKYFDHVIQSRAEKKARLIILSQKKEVLSDLLIRSINYNNQEIRQYFGVFSADHIDYATQYLIERIDIKFNEKKILDLASGNGILAKVAQDLSPESDVYLLDDSYLAIESSKLNINKEKATFIHDNTLNQLEDNLFDLVISNPPFHFEYEINISVPLGMFTQVERCLKPNGRFILVANTHLQYKVHLENKFSRVKIIDENKKYRVYECYK